MDDGWELPVLAQVTRAGIAGGTEGEREGLLAGMIRKWSMRLN
jgi:hypothetical protein